VVAHPLLQPVDPVLGRPVVAPLDVGRALVQHREIDLRRVLEGDDDDLEKLTIELRSCGYDEARVKAYFDAQIKPDRTTALLHSLHAQWDRKKREE
jgi:hypothetical protein